MLILLGLIVISVVDRQIDLGPRNDKNAHGRSKYGNQWWWYVRYLNDDASRIVVTANEIHIPVGRPVMIRGTSNDVIHSFWVPNLHGKRDLIPSRVTTEWIQADQPGPLSRPVRGVLRTAARAHGVLGRRRAAGASSSLDAAPAAARRRARRSRSSSAASRCS